MGNLLGNVRYAWRQLKHSPGFAWTVIVTLALGVGANAVAFGVLNALLLKPLPAIQDSSRVLFLNRTAKGIPGSMPSQSYPDYRDLRDQNRSFTGLASYRVNRVGLGTAGAVTQAWMEEVSENYFDVLELRPKLGRFFHASDAHGPDSMPYVVLSYAYWQGKFGGDPDIVGRTVDVNKNPMTVLGVAQSGFGGTDLFLSPDVWLPRLDQSYLEGFNNLEARNSRGTWVVGRLKTGVSKEEAEGDLNTIAARLGGQYKEDEGMHYRLSRPGFVGEYFGGSISGFLYGVMGLTALVLLAACANLGSLFAARSADRAREMAVRLALGAERRAVIAQLVTEAVMVSLVGGLAGLGLAGVVLRQLSLWRPSEQYPLQITVAPDWRVAVVTLALAVGCGVFFGLVPLRQVFGGDPYGVIKSGASSGEAAGRARLTLGDGLLLLQIALCSVLVTAALVAGRGLERSLHMDYGFKPEGAMLVSFDLSMVGKDNPQSLLFQRRAVEEISALPGVEAVSFSDATPLDLGNSETDVYRDGTTDFRPANTVASANYFDVSPGYFHAVGTRLVAGREFRWTDDAKAPDVTVVNEEFVREIFGAGVSPAEAVGRWFVSEGHRQQVVGVAGDGKYESLAEAPKPVIFFASAQGPDTYTVMEVRRRAGVDGAAVAAAVQKTLLGLEPNLPLLEVGWMESLGTALLPAIGATVALGVIGGLAAMLAVTGIFGSASYAVSRRLRELGIRMALGAQRMEVLRAALARPVMLLVGGSALGLACGAAGGRLLEHVVYGASSHDPVVLGGVVLAMAGLALVASWVPAQRALGVDPARLLREE